MKNIFLFEFYLSFRFLQGAGAKFLVIFLDLNARKTINCTFKSSAENEGEIENAVFAVECERKKGVSEECV